MSIRQKALAAAADADTSLRTRVRDALTTFGLDWQADGLQVDRVDFEHDRVVVTDGTVRLAVDAPADREARVVLVEVQDGQLARVSEPLGGLADLGRLLKDRR